MQDIKNFTATYGYDQFNSKLTWGYAQWLHVDHVAGQHNKETQFFDCYKNNRRQPGMTETANRIAEHLQYLYSQQPWQLQTRISRSMCYVNGTNNNERHYGSAAQIITVFQNTGTQEEPVFAVMLFHDDTAIINGAKSRHNGRWQLTFPQKNMRASEQLIDQLALAEPV